MRSALALGLLALASCGSSAPSAKDSPEPSAALAEAVVPSAAATQPKASAMPAVTVKEVPQVRGASTTRSDILIEAIGTEPFWAINVMLGRLTYRTPDSPGWILVQTELTDEGDRLRYTGKLDGKELTLVIGKGTCSDGMSDTVYPLTAKLTIGSETRQGCARPK